MNLIKLLVFDIGISLIVRSLGHLKISYNFHHWLPLTGISPILCKATNSCSILGNPCNDLDVFVIKVIGILGYSFEAPVLKLISSIL
jgi:hypothetical protein